MVVYGPTMLMMALAAASLQAIASAPATTTTPAPFQPVDTLNATATATTTATATKDRPLNGTTNRDADTAAGPTSGVIHATSVTDATIKGNQPDIASILADLATDVLGMVVLGLFSSISLYLLICVCDNCAGRRGLGRHRRLRRRPRTAAAELCSRYRPPPTYDEDVEMQLLNQVSGDPEPQEEVACSAPPPPTPRPSPQAQELDRPEESVASGPTTAHSAAEDDGDGDGGESTGCLELDSPLANRTCTHARMHVAQVAKLQLSSTLNDTLSV